MQCYETRMLLSDAMNDSDFLTSRAAYILSGVNKPSGAEPISLVVDPVFSGISPSRPFSDKCVLYFGVDWSTEYCGFVDYIDTELSVNLLLLYYS